MQKIEVKGHFFKRWNGSKRTDGRTRPIALPCPLTLSVFLRDLIACKDWYEGDDKCTLSEDESVTG